MQPHRSLAGVAAAAARTDVSLAGHRAQREGAEAAWAGLQNWVVLKSGAGRRGKGQTAERKGKKAHTCMRRRMSPLCPSPFHYFPPHQWGGRSVPPPHKGKQTLTREKRQRKVEEPLPLGASCCELSCPCIAGNTGEQFTCKYRVSSTTKHRLEKKNEKEKRPGLHHRP